MSDVDRELREMHREFVEHLGEVLDIEAGLAEVLGIPPGFPSWYVPERPALPTGPLGRAQRQLAELLAHPLIQEVMSRSVLDEEPARTGAYLRAGTLVIDGVPQPPPPSFAAYVACPQCGRYECHKMREPRPAPTEAELAEWRERAVEIAVWGGGTVRTVPPRPPDESGYEVIRMCDCGYEWGMA
jgi:hypothetical protein